MMAVEAGIVGRTKGLRRIAEEVGEVGIVASVRIPPVDIDGLRDVGRPDERIGGVALGAFDRVSNPAGGHPHGIRRGRAIGRARDTPAVDAAIALRADLALEEAGPAGRAVVLDDRDVVEKLIGFGLRNVAIEILAAQGERKHAGPAGVELLDARERHTLLVDHLQLHRLVAGIDGPGLDHAVDRDGQQFSGEAIERRNASHLGGAAVRIGRAIRDLGKCGHTRKGQRDEGEAKPHGSSPHVGGDPLPHAPTSSYD